MLQRSERHILKCISQGKPEAFEAVINQHYRSVYSFLAYLSSDTNVAEDLTQDTFTSAWMNIDRYKGRASLKTWLHRIAYNKFLDSERGKRKRSEFISGWKESNSNVQTTSDPLYKITEDEHSYLLLKAMYKLESADYIVIILHYIQDFSYREMANVLNEPVGTIKWRTSQALKRLRDLLTDRI